MSDLREKGTAYREAEAQLKANNYYYFFIQRSNFNAVVLQIFAKPAAD